MNLSNLKVGQTIPNYKSLCIALGEEVKSGSSKRAQIKEWGCHFKYARDGHDYTIKKIYPRRIPKADKRTENSPYIKHVEKILLHLLSAHPRNTLALSRKDLHRALGIIPNELVRPFGLPRGKRGRLNARLHAKLEDISRNALSSMVSRGVLSDCRKSGRETHITLNPHQEHPRVDGQGYLTAIDELRRAVVNYLEVLVKKYEMEDAS